MPEGLTVYPALALIVASFFTSALTAAVGIGGGLTMLALMAYVVPPLALIPVHGLVQLGSNASRAHLLRQHTSWSAVVPFLVGAAIGASLGAMVAVQLPQSLLQIILAVFILLILWISLPTIEKANPSIIGAGGATTTFLTMFVGATGPLTALLFERLFEDRRKLVATNATAMSFQHGFKIIAFGIAGFALFEWLPFIIAMVLTGYFGTIAGTRLLEGLPEKTFRAVFKWVLTLIAIDLLRRGLFAS